MSVASWDRGGLTALEKGAIATRDARLLELERREDVLIRRDAARKERLEDFQVLSHQNLLLIDECECAMPGLLHRIGVDGEELRYGARRSVEQMSDDLEAGRRERMRIRDEEDRVEREFRDVMRRVEGESDGQCRPIGKGLTPRAFGNGAPSELFNPNETVRYER